MLRVATICAREGSKGLPGKNKKTIDGIPLFGRAILQAAATNLFDEIVVSTDDTEIIQKSSSFGASRIILRPSALSGDTVSKPKTILHALTETEARTGKSFDVVVDLDVTSPLRNLEDIISTIMLLEKSKVSSVVTACISRRNPYFNILEQNQSGHWNISKQVNTAYVSRQEAPLTFDMNAAIHAWFTSSLRSEPKVIYDDTKVFLMPPERSYDIDSEVDFEIVKFLIGRYKVGNVN